MDGNERKLKKSIEANQNLSEEVKKSIMSLIELLTAVYPQYNYDSLASKLTNLKIDMRW